MNKEMILLAAVEYVRACGPIWDVEDCQAQRDFIEKLDLIEKAELYRRIKPKGIAEKRPDTWTKTP